MDENSTLKSIGAIVLTLALFLGVGWYVYSALFVTPSAQPQDEIVAVQAQGPTAASTTTEHPG